MGKYRYKDSGVEWLALLPEHWSVTKVKNKSWLIPSNVNKKSLDNQREVKLCNYVDVYYNNYITKDLPFMTATASENEISKFQLRVGDVIITKDSEDPNDIGVPALVTETFDRLVCGYHLSMLRPKNEDLLGSYLFWCLKDISIISQLHREATGVTRWAISTRNIKNYTIPFPPLEEQKQISKYLDIVSEKIDKIIELKFGNTKPSHSDSVNQLNLLIEYRNSLIHECVTGKKQVAKMHINKVKIVQ